MCGGRGAALFLAAGPATAAVPLLVQGGKAQEDGMGGAGEPAPVNGRSCKSCSLPAGPVEILCAACSSLLPPPSEQVSGLG